MQVLIKSSLYVVVNYHDNNKILYYDKTLAAPTLAELQGSEKALWVADFGEQKDMWQNCWCLWFDQKRKILIVVLLGELFFLARFGMAVQREGAPTHWSSGPDSWVESYVSLSSCAHGHVGRWTLARKVRLDSHSERRTPLLEEVRWNKRKETILGKQSH